MIAAKILLAWPILLALSALLYYCNTPDRGAETVYVTRFGEFWSSIIFRRFAACTATFSTVLALAAILWMCAQ